MTLCPVILEVAGGAAARTAAQVAAQRAAARAALVESAILCHAPRDGWVQGAAGIPMVNDGWHWSVAHTRRYAVGVVSRSPVGVDIEAIIPRRETLWEALADASEWMLLGGRSWPAFFRLWTAKEAVVKSVGEGIGAFGECRLVGVEAEGNLVLALHGKERRVAHFPFDGHVVAATVDNDSVEWQSYSEAGRRPVPENSSGCLTL